MKYDFLGNELNIGDKVAFWDRYHKHFRTGIIYKFYPVKISVEYENSCGNKSHKDIFGGDCIKI